MPVSTKIIKRRIKAVTSTRKITKAMELVAASKMRRAVDAALSSRRYAVLAWQLLTNLSEQTGGAHPLFTKRNIKKMLLIIVTSNKGLCGGLNANIIKKIKSTVNEEAYSQVEIEAVAVGKKGAHFCKKSGIPLIAVFDSLPDTPELSDVLPVSKVATDEYLSGNFDKVAIIYTDFVSSIAQKPKMRQILPVSKRDIEKTIVETRTASSDDERKIEQGHYDEGVYIFEPDKSALLNVVAPRLVETQIYQSMLEAFASEHSSRMLSMRNATEAAEEMIDDLSFTFNQARQAGITRELTEISAGVAALK